MSSAYAFSPFGYSGSFAGFGDTEPPAPTRGSSIGSNFASPGAGFRVGGLAQWGGYDQGNGPRRAGPGRHRLQHLFGTLGRKAVAGPIGDYAQNAVNLSTFTGSCATLTNGPFAGQTDCTSGIPEFYSNTDLKATLSNNTGFMLLAKYKWGALAVSGGYAWLKQADPSSTFPNGFQTIGGWNVPATIPSTFPDARSSGRPNGSVHHLRCSEDRSHSGFRRQICSHSATRRKRPPSITLSDRLQFLNACANTNTTFVEPNGNKFTVSRSNSGSCADRRTSSPRSSTIGRSSASTSTPA